jgi:hypothetical protein
MVGWEPASATRRWELAWVIWLSVALGLWWCLGTIRKSLNMLTAQKLVAAFPIFAIGFSALMVFLLALLPASIDTSREIAAEAQKEALHRAAAAKPWHNQAWSVVAIPELHRLAASGTLGKGSAEVLRDLMHQYPELKLIELDSTGGLVREEDQIVDLLREHHMDTLVVNRCASACTGIFLAGERRFVGPSARLAFHQSGYFGRSNDTEWEIPEYEASIYYRERGVADAFAEHALNTSYYSAWYPDVLEVKRAGFATNWWSERPAQYQ